MTKKTETVNRLEIVGEIMDWIDYTNCPSFEKLELIAEKKPNWKEILSNHYYHSAIFCYIQSKNLR